MFRIFSLFDSNDTITFDQLKSLQLLSLQAVCTVETLYDVSEAKKRELACSYTRRLLEEVSITVPQPLIETAVRTSIFSLQEVRKEDRDPTLCLIPEGIW